MAKGRKPVSKRLKLKGIKRTENKLNAWNVAMMNNAINEYNRTANSSVVNDRCLSIRALARAWNVPRSTLRDRIVGNTTRVAPSSGRNPIFDVKQEAELVDLVLMLSKSGFGLTRLDVRKVAFEYAEKNNIPGFSVKKQLAGYDWFSGFLSRHPKLSVRKPENLSAARASGMNKPVVKKYFHDLEKCLKENGIFGDPSRLWNCDETGVQDQFDSGDVVASISGRCFNITANEKGTTSTLMCAISADGLRSPLLTIFKGIL